MRLYRKYGRPRIKDKIKRLLLFTIKRLHFSEHVCIMSCVAQNATQIIGLSPSGKATDSDSVTSKVRILLAQLII